MVHNAWARWTTYNRVHHPVTLAKTGYSSIFKKLATDYANENANIREEFIDNYSYVRV